MSSIPDVPRCRAPARLRSERSAQLPTRLCRESGLPADSPAATKEFSSLSARPLGNSTPASLLLLLLLGPTQAGGLWKAESGPFGYPSSLLKGLFRSFSSEGVIPCCQLRGSYSMFSYTPDT